MKKGLIVAIIGIIITVAGGVFFLMSLGELVSPADKAVWDGESDSGAIYSNASLDAGEYEVWYESNYMSPSVVVQDSSGSLVYANYALDRSTETITVGDHKYKKMGSFDAPRDDTYTIMISGDAAVYITPPMDTLDDITAFCGGIALIAVGLSVMTIGVILHFLAKKKERQASQPQQVQVQAPQQQVYYQQYPQQQQHQQQQPAPAYDPSLIYEPPPPPEPPKH